MQLRIFRRGRVHPPVRPSVSPSVGWSIRRLVHPSVHSYVQCFFQTTNMAVFENKKSSNNIIINDAMSDNEVVAPDVPRGALMKIGGLVFDTTT